MIVSTAFRENLARRLGFTDQGNLNKFVTKIAIQKPWRTIRNRLGQGPPGKVVLKMAARAVEYRAPKYHLRPGQLVAGDTRELYAFFICQVVTNLQEPGEIWEGKEDFKEIGQIALDILRLLRRIQSTDDKNARRTAARAKRAATRAKRARMNSVVASVDDSEDDEYDEPNQHIAKRVRKTPRAFVIEDDEDDEEEEEEEDDDEEEQDEDEEYMEDEEPLAEKPTRPRALVRAPMGREIVGDQANLRGPVKIKQERTETAYPMNGKRAPGSTMNQAVDLTLDKKQRRLKLLRDQLAGEEKKSMIRQSILQLYDEE